MSGKNFLFGYCAVICCFTIIWILFNNRYERPKIKLEKHFVNSTKPVHNITKTENISDAEYLFNINFKYLINNRVCDKGNPKITAVIIVTSYYGNIETRSAMRRAFTEEELIGFDFRRVFLIAIPPESDKSISHKAILNENDRFGDLIQGNFIEAYRNLTYKHTMGLNWAAKYCSNAKYLIKMDDDIVVDIYKLSEFLSKFTGINKKPIAGYILNNMAPVREPASKWFVTKKEYAPSMYPQFVSGWFYITTPKIAKALVKLTKKVPYFWIDDVYITGILAKVLRIKLLDISYIFAVHPEYLQCCMQDLKAHKYKCPIIVGPNGGDNNLFFTYNEIMSHCYIYSCKERPKEKNLNKTCVAGRKIYVEHGQAVVKSIPLI